MQLPAFEKERDSRRRSVDVGGLALAMGGSALGQEGTGKGWGGWEEGRGPENNMEERPEWV